MNSRALAVAFSVTAAVLWSICGLLILLMPAQMAGMSGHMIHADLTSMQWHMPLASFVVGGILWVVVAGLTGYLIGLIYNVIIKPST